MFINFFNILLKIIFFFFKKNYLNVFFLFNQNYYCFRFVNNKFFIIKYLKFFSWNILKNIDLILNINNYISNSNLIFKKNIPVIIFSKLRIFRNNYSFIYFISSKYFYIFFLLILQNLKLRKKKKKV